MPVIRRAITVVLALYCLPMLISQRAAAQGTSTAEERAEWAETTHKLEISPLDETVNKQGELVLKGVEDAHDFHVILCPALLNEFNGMKYTYSHAITRQYMLASAAFLIENPSKTSDLGAMNLSAVESVLKMYRAIIQNKPDAKVKALDDFVKKQDLGKLKDSIPKECR